MAGTSVTYQTITKQNGKVRFGPYEGHSINLRERTFKVSDLTKFSGTPTAASPTVWKAPIRQSTNLLKERQGPS